MPTARWTGASTGRIHLPLEPVPRGRGPLVDADAHRGRRLGPRGGLPPGGHRATTPTRPSKSASVPALISYFGPRFSHRERLPEPGCGVGQRRRRHRSAGRPARRCGPGPGPGPALGVLARKWLPSPRTPGSAALALHAARQVDRVAPQVVGDAWRHDPDRPGVDAGTQGDELVPGADRPSTPCRGRGGYPDLVTGALGREAAGDVGIPDRRPSRRWKGVVEAREDLVEQLHHAPGEAAASGHDAANRTVASRRRRERRPWAAPMVAGRGFRYAPPTGRAPARGPGHGRGR